MKFPHGETVTVIRYPNGRVDKYGDPLEPTQFTVGPCAISYKSSTETNNNRLGTENDNFRLNAFSSATILAPAGTQFYPGDEVITADGRKWGVDGESMAPHSPFTGWRPGVKATLRRYSG